MSVQTLTLGKKKFVVVEEKEFRRLQAQAEELTNQDRGDIAEVKRRKAKGGGIRPYSQLRKKLGVA